MVQMPRGAALVAADSFGVGAVTVGALRDGAVAVRVELLSARADGLPLDVAVVEAVRTGVVLLDERDGADATTVGDPDERTLGPAVLGAGVAVGAGAAAVAV